MSDRVDDDDDEATTAEADGGGGAFAALLAELAAGPTAPTWSLLEQRVGRYEVTARLGRGGMGEVYRAYDPELSREVALKVLMPDAGTDLLDEARAAARLKSPFIAGVYDVLTHDELTVIAMELVEGPSLWALLDARPIGADEAMRIASGVAEALAVAHAAGIVHRDVKPGNVLLREDGHPLLVDFGLATHAGDDTGPQGGTPRYAPPEQHAGAPPTPAADVYAYGVTLQELIARCEAPPAQLRSLAAQCTQEVAEQRPPHGAALLELLAPPSRSAGWAVVALITLIAVASGIPMLVSSVGPQRPPSIESIPTVTDDRKAQRSFVLAVQALYAGDREAAARALGPVLEANPEDPAPWLMAAHLPPPPSPSTTSAEARLSAIATSGAARAPLAAFARRALALKPWAPGQEVPALEAAALADEAQALIDAHPDAWFDHLLIIRSLPRGDQHQRLKLLDELEQRDDGPPILALARAWGLQHLKRDAEARAVLERAALAHPGNDALARELAVLLLDEDPAAAIATLEPIVRRRPQDGVIRFSLAEAYLRAGDDRWQEVLDDLHRGGFDPFLVGRGTLMFSEAVSALGRPDLADARRRDGIERLRALDAIAEIANGYRRAVQEAIERRDAPALKGWLKAAHAFADAHPTSAPLAVERLRTTLLVGGVHEHLAVGERAAARSDLEALGKRPMTTFGPDVTRARVLAEATAALAAAEQDKAAVLDALASAAAGGRSRDLQHPPPALLAGDLKRRLGLSAEAAADYRSVLDRTEDCLAATLFWEVRCRRDLVRALDALWVLAPDERSAWQQARRRAQPLAAGRPSR